MKSNIFNIKTFNMEKIGLWILGLLTGGLSFFAPIEGMVYLMTALVCFDTITAIIRTIKAKNIKGFRNNARLIQSAKLRRSGLKLVFYIIFLMLIYATELVIIGKSFYIHNLLAFIFAFTEIKSIAENVDICLGTDMFTSSVKRIRKIFEDKTAKMMSTEDKTTNTEI